MRSAIPLAKFSRPLAHATHADANASRPQLGDGIGNTLTMVSNRHDQPAIVLGEGHRSLCSRMPVYVGESLLGGRWRSPARMRAGKILRLDIERSSDAAAFGESLKVPPKAESSPTSSSKGGCKRCDRLRTCWMARIDRSLASVAARSLDFAGLFTRMPLIIIFAATSFAPVEAHARCAASSSCMVSSRLERRAAVLSSTI